MMFLFAILLGIYSYVIFFLGILGWLYEWVIVGVTVLFWGGVLVGCRKSLIRMVGEVRKVWVTRNRMVLLFGTLFALQAGVNLIGVLGPELGFDALWYHLTLPKLYLINNAIDFIPGGLLYYSAMPKLAEMLYTAGLAFGNENLVKFIHYSFGLLTCFALYKLGRKFLNPVLSLIAVVIFYSNLVVGWESTSAYIDLVRAFFEVMALWAFVEWTSPLSTPVKQASSFVRSSPKRRGSYKWFVLSALMVGLAITTKLLAIGSLIIFSILMVFDVGRRTKDLGRKENDFFLRLKSYVLSLTSYIFIALLVPLPWFIFSYLHTGNPVYPFFTDVYKVVPEPLSLVGFVKDVWILFTQASDPISLVYVLFLPVAGWMLVSRGLRIREVREVREVGVIAVYSLLAIVIWYFTPRTGGGRFILPYLPAFSLLCALFIHYVWKNVSLRKFLVIVVLGAAAFSLMYRFAANWKYVPVIIGKETKAQFLADHLHFDFGDFYDVDGYFAKTIKPSDKVLLIGFHNLYYVDFPFVDNSMIGEIRDIREIGGINYIAVQKGELSKEYKDWKLVYENKKTMVKLYKMD